MFRYFRMKKLEREMKYELLSEFYLLIANKKKYIDLIKNLAELPKENLQTELVNKLAELINEEKNKEV